MAQSNLVSFLLLRHWTYYVILVYVNMVNGHLYADTSPCLLKGACVHITAPLPHDKHWLVTDKHLCEQL